MRYFFWYEVRRSHDFRRDERERDYGEDRAGGFHAVRFAVVVGRARLRG
jgi:hypothetical protein